MLEGQQETHLPPLKLQQLLGATRGDTRSTATLLITTGFTSAKPPRDGSDLSAASQAPPRSPRARFLSGFSAGQEAALLSASTGAWANPSGCHCGTTCGHHRTSLSASTSPVRLCQARITWASRPRVLKEYLWTMEITLGQFPYP